MNDGLRTLGPVCGPLSSALCLLTGVWVLTVAGCDRKNETEPLYTPIGLYLVGNAFFVGLMMVITSRRRSTA